MSTLNSGARSFCSSPRFSRSLLICSPIVLGSKSHVFFIKHLRTTRTNGKKATHVCFCGYHGDRERECRCTPERVKQYQQRISGPLLDRIDLQVHVPRLNTTERDALLQYEHTVGSDSATIRKQVITSRQLQLARAGCCNARLEQQQIKQYCALKAADRKLLADAVNRLRLSARATFRILKIARTIADLSESENVDTSHVLEAIAYRRFDTN
jgi:magnesium chelatase family protein